MLDISIRPERPEEFDRIDALVRRSFAEGTPYSNGDSEVALIHEIREGKYYLPELSFVALYKNEIVGHFMFSRFPLSPSYEERGDAENDTPIVMLAPVAVSADYLRRGVGTAMILQGLERVKAKGYRGVTVEGNPAFYNTLGFRTSLEFGIQPPPTGFAAEHHECMMAQELYEGALSGIAGCVVYWMYKNA